MDNKKSIDLHEIACTLFPHIREKEDDKKKAMILKNKNWLYNPENFCFERKGIRIDSYIVFDYTVNELEEYLKMIDSKENL